MDAGVAAQAECSTNVGISITFSGCVENHTGNQMLGQMMPEGVSVAQLQALQAHLRARGRTCELVRLDELFRRENPDLASLPQLQEAAVLVARHYVQGEALAALNADMCSFAWDRKFFHARQRKVMNKWARANVCFAAEAQAPDYEAGRGTVVPFSQLPALRAVRGRVDADLREGAGYRVPLLLAEGNRYDFRRNADPVTRKTKGETGIGWHGDTERRLVACVRAGDTSTPLMFRFYTRSRPVGEKMSLALAPGDLYVMSHYATGFNWMKPSLLTLRHAAGTAKYTDPTPRKPRAEAGKRKAMERA